MIEGDGYFCNFKTHRGYFRKFEKHDGYIWSFPLFNLIPEYIVSCNRNSAKILRLKFGPRMTLQLIGYIIARNLFPISPPLSPFTLADTSYQETPSAQNPTTILFSHEDFRQIVFYHFPR